MQYQQQPATLDELKFLIAKKLDVDEFLDILGYDMYDLVESLEDEVGQNFEKLLDACK